MEIPAEVIEQVQRVNRVLSSQRTLPVKLEAVAELLQQSVSNCDAVSIALTVDDKAVTGAASGSLAIEADIVQYATWDGPCLLAAQTGSAVRVDVLQHHEQFEHFAPGARELGVNSVLSIPMVHNELTVGTINLYSTHPSAFGPESFVEARRLCDYAASLIGRSNLYAEALWLAGGVVAFIRDEAAIAQATGILRIRNRLSESQALGELLAHADEHHVSLPQAARLILASTGPG